MQPDEFCNLAEALVNDPNAEEAARRSAAHLAYYSVYHALLLHFGLSSSDWSQASHGALKNKLNVLQPAGQPSWVMKARRYFSYLHNNRVDADYKLNTIFTIENAEDSIEWAKAIFKLRP